MSSSRHGECPRSWGVRLLAVEPRASAAAIQTNSFQSCSITDVASRARESRRARNRLQEDGHQRRNPCDSRECSRGCTGSDRSAEPRCRFGACRAVRLHPPFRENPGGARRCVPQAEGSPQADGHALGLVTEEQEDENRPRTAEGHRDRLQARACREQDPERGRHVVGHKVHAPQEGQSVQQQLWATSAPVAESVS